MPELSPTPALILFYSCLMALVFLAAVLSILNVVRMAEIHRMVNRNAAEQAAQRAEMASLRGELTQALAAATRAELALERLRSNTLPGREAAQG